MARLVNRASQSGGSPLELPRSVEVLLGLLIMLCRSALVGAKINYMRKLLFTAATLSVAILLLENCPAQQTAGPASQPASAGVGSPAPKPATTADVKNTPAPSLPA